MSQKQPSKLLVPVTMALMFVLAALGSVAFSESFLPLFGVTLLQAKERGAGADSNSISLTTSQEETRVKDQSSQSTTQDSPEKRLVLQAKKDLAQRLTVKVDKVKLLEIRAVTWPDSSIGCPKEGEVYDQTPQKGFLIRLESGGRMFFYHSAGTGIPFFCEKASRMVPHPPKGDEFIPRPGIDVD